MQHFKSLFAERPIDQEEAERFVDNTVLKKLSAAGFQELDTPISLEELTETVRKLSRNRAPGTDGFPSEFFKVFLLGKVKDVFLPHDY